MRNNYSLPEDYIRFFYLDISIHNPNDLGVSAISSKLNKKVNYYDGTSMYAFNHFFINRSITAAEQRQDFGHEVCHALWQVGNQCILPSSFVQYQEWKANSFMYEFCVPEFMLRSLIDGSELQSYQYNHRKF